MASPPRRARLIMSVAALAVAGCTEVVRLPGTNTDGGGGGPGTCWGMAVTREMVAPEAIIAFDRSSTMDERVEPVRAALVPALAVLGRAVEIGYLQFPDSRCDDQSCCEASDVLVAPALDTAAAISSQLACNPTGGACVRPGAHRTPTDDALRTIARYWSDPPQDADRFAVIITDGPPNCDGDTDFPCGRAHRAAMDLFGSRSKVTTVILAISRLTLSTCLDRVAADGGNAFSNGTASGLHLVWIDDVTLPAVLRDAVSQVLSPIKRRTCVVKLPGPRSRVADVVVRVGDAVVGYDQGHTDGWDFEPGRGDRLPAEVRLYGPRCDDIQRGLVPPHAVTATITCQDCGNGIECR
jgi:hypothetical protein